MNMCMIVDTANHRVLVQDKVHAKWPGITFPGGHVDDAESIYDSAIREAKEETGLVLSDLEQVGLIHMYNPDTHDRRLIFLYKTTHFQGEIIGETREGKVYWLNMEDLGKTKLSPNMHEYLKLFFHDELIEAYVTPGPDGESIFKFT